MSRQINTGFELERALSGDSEMERHLHAFHPDRYQALQDHRQWERENAPVPRQVPASEVIWNRMRPESWNV